MQNLPIATGYTHVTALVILIAIQTAQVLHLAILVDVHLVYAHNALARAIKGGRWLMLDV